MEVAAVVIMMNSILLVARSTSNWMSPLMNRSLAKELPQQLLLD